MYATALLCEFLQHIGRILNAYFPEDKPAEIFLTAVQYGMPHRESVRRLLYDSDFNHGSLRFRSWDNSIFSQGTFAGYDNYEEQAERMNAESAHEIAKELFALECEQRRLTYFIGLLDKRQAEVIRLVFVDGIPTKEVAASFGLTYRTIDRIKRTAIENLAEMYAYSDQFRV